MKNILVLDKIVKNFSQAGETIEVIKEANLTIKEGEMVSLLGPSGSGKTTILQIAGLLDSPTAGNITINTIDASKADDALRTQLRKEHIGFVYQFHHLLPEFSALENAAMPLLIQGKDKKTALQEAEKILEQVGLKDRMHHKPAELSGGQQQRVAIARAIIGKPSLILADEPTGNLDSAFADKIFSLLQELTKQYNIGCLVVTHNLELAKRSDRIVSIKNGVIA